MRITTSVLGDLCDNIGLVGVSAKWSYVTASPSHHDQAIPLLSPLVYMHVGHPYIPLFKSQRIFDLLVKICTSYVPCVISANVHMVYMYLHNPISVLSRKIEYAHDFTIYVPVRASTPT